MYAIVVMMLVLLFSAAVPVVAVTIEGVNPGERPGSGHHNFSIYIASPKAKLWQEKKVDHDIVRVISGVSNTALLPAKAAAETVRLIKMINAR